jgi:hypothetical protein
MAQRIYTHNTNASIPDSFYLNSPPPRPTPLLLQRAIPGNRRIRLTKALAHVRPLQREAAPLAVVPAPRRHFAIAIMAASVPTTTQH